MRTCCLILFALAVAHTTMSQAMNDLHNRRLKMQVLSDTPLSEKPEMYFETVVAAGIWVPQSTGEGGPLILPTQVKILCAKSVNECSELSVVLGPVPDKVSVADLKIAYYVIRQWDQHGLSASYGGDESSRCQRHVLTMDFDSGAVGLADVPTHNGGCENATATYSYSLVNGTYYVDTTPGNDVDKRGRSRK
jgi:hypothetical protein